MIGASDQSCWLAEACTILLLLLLLLCCDLYHVQQYLIAKRSSYCAHLSLQAYICAPTALHLMGHYLVFSREQ